jgi:hypothetical protein
VAKCRFKWAYNPTGDQNSAKVRGGSRPLLFSFIVLPITIVPYLQYLGRSLEVGLMKTLSRLMRTWRWSKPHFSRMSCGSIMMSMDWCDGIEVCICLWQWLLAVTHVYLFVHEHRQLYPERQFSTKLENIRREVECAFWILKKWHRILNTRLLPAGSLKYSAKKEWLLCEFDQTLALIQKSVDAEEVDKHQSGKLLQRGSTTRGLMPEVGDNVWLANP